MDGKWIDTRLAHITVFGRSAIDEEGEGSIITFLFCVAGILRNGSSGHQTPNCERETKEVKNVAQCDFLMKDDGCMDLRTPLTRMWKEFVPVKLR
jgi:hypothetical protein